MFSVYAFIRYFPCYLRQILIHERHLAQLGSYECHYFLAAKFIEEAIRTEHYEVIDEWIDLQHADFGLGCNVILAQHLSVYQECLEFEVSKCPCNC